MKIVLALLLMLSCQAFAYEDNYFGDVGDYDIDSGQYYLMVMGKQGKSGLLSSGKERSSINLFIYNPAKKMGRNLFVKPVGKISNVVIESDYDVKTKKMIFLSGNDKSKNNQNIDPRKPNSMLIVETLDPTEKQNTVWKADKLGGEPKALFTYEYPDSWHLDTRARVIRLLKNTAGTYNVSEYPW